MTAKYFALLTTIGAAKLANATALGNPLAITDMAVGDANGTDPTPDPAQTALVNECHRAQLNSLSVDPGNANQVIAEQVLAETVGGWWIREIGLIDADGDLIAVGNCPPSYKPQMDEGSGREQIIRMVLIVSSTDAVELKIDPSVVLATREYVDDAIEGHAKSRNHPDASTTAKGLVQLSSSTTSDSETLAATPKAVKAAFDNAENKVAKGGDTMTGPLGIKSTVTVYEDDVNTISEFLYSYNEAGVQTKKVGIKAICDADGAGHWVVDVNPAAKGDSRVQAFGIDGKSKLVTTMNDFQLYEGTERVFSANNPQPMFGTGTAAIQLPTTNTLAELKKYGGGKFVVFAGSSDMPVSTIAYSLDWVATSNRIGTYSATGTLTATALVDAGNAKRATYHNVCYQGEWQGWDESFSVNNPPTADDINAVKKTGDTMTGALNVDAKISLSDGLEIGNQKTPSPAYIDFHTDGTETDYNARIISPQGSTELQLIAADNANNGSGIVRMLGSKADQLSFALQGTAHSALAWRKWGSAERPTVLELDIDGGPWLIGVDHTTDNKAALGVNGVLNCEGVNVGSTARMVADGNIWGTRWNSSGGWLWDAIVAQIQNIGQMSVNGTQWWTKINLNGGTLIVQGGYAEVQDAETTDRIGLNIAVPNSLLGVFITNKNFAQGYATYNPQVTDLTNERDGFNFVHGQKEHMMYWIAVGY